MKKLVTAFAACMIAGLVSAQVQSQNVVGYQTVTINPGFNMFALNFDSVTNASSLGQMGIQGIFPAASLTAGQNSGTSDQIQVWDNSTGAFTLYYYRANKTTVPVWTLGPAWVKSTAPNTVSTDTIKSGQGFWFKHYGSTTNDAVVAGQVLVANSKTNSLAVGFNMIGSAYPVEFPLNGASCPFDWSTATAGQNSGTSDQIQIWNNSTGAFTLYYYRANKTTVPVWTLGPAWVKSTAPNTVTTDTISDKTGFWYKKYSTSANIVQQSPLAP